jgi:hypothetical protein
LPPSARSCRAPHEGPEMFGARVVDGQAGALSRDRPGRAAAAQRARRRPPYQSLLLRTGSIDATPPTRIAFP